jgi:hypothetical protein
MKFVGRKRRPPLDPVNSLLSLGYTLLTYEAFSASTRIRASAIPTSENRLLLTRVNRRIPKSALIHSQFIELC